MQPPQQQSQQHLQQQQQLQEHQLLQQQPLQQQPLQQQQLQPQQQQSLQREQHQKEKQCQVPRKRPREKTVEDKGPAAVAMAPIVSHEHCVWNACTISVYSLLYLV